MTDQRAEHDTAPGAWRPTPPGSDRRTVRGGVRLLGVLLLVWEPITFAAAAAGAFNAIAVRGWPVALVLAARLVATALCVAAGRALLDARPSALLLARAGLVLSGAVQIVGLVTPYFPSNRLPGQTPWYVTAIAAYYGAWLMYLARSRVVAATFR